ncbi:MAG: hypothetical protein R6U50_10320 [Desulfobacterales bacterium]
MHKTFAPNTQSADLHPDCSGGGLCWHWRDYRCGLYSPVIVLNNGLGAFQEYNAEKSAAGLRKLLKINARVQRSGAQTEIPAENLVPGDIVLLESGNKVPVDLRLLDVSGLTADESFLTGESLAADKKADVLMESLAVADRANMAFAGASITSGPGHGRGGGHRHGH